MLNLCVLEFVRNENGFFVAAQSAATACLRSYLKGRGVQVIGAGVQDVAADGAVVAQGRFVLGKAR